MLLRTGVALAAAMLVLPLTVVAQKSRRSRSSLSRSSAKKQIIKSQHHFDDTAEVVNSQEIDCCEAEQQRQDQAQRLCTSGVHEADRLSERAEGVTSLIISSRSNVVVLMNHRICNGKLFMERRLKIEAKETVGENKFS